MEDFKQAVNVHLDAVEHGNGIVFLHSVEEGPASQSYGLQVAQLAGIPKSVVAAARRKLMQLEQQQSVSGPQADLFATEQIEPEPVRHDAIRELEMIEPDELTPKQALETLYRLKLLVKD